MTSLNKQNIIIKFENAEKIYVNTDLKAIKIMSNKITNIDFPDLEICNIFEEKNKELDIIENKITFKIGNIPKHKQFYESVEAIEMNVIQDIIKNPRWYGKPMSESEVGEKFKSCLTADVTGKFITIRSTLSIANSVKIGSIVRCTVSAKAIMIYGEYALLDLLIHKVVVINQESKQRSFFNTPNVPASIPISEVVSNTEKILDTKDLFEVPEDIDSVSDNIPKIHEIVNQIPITSEIPETIDQIPTTTTSEILEIIDQLPTILENSHETIDQIPKILDNLPTITESISEIPTNILDPINGSLIDIPNTSSIENPFDGPEILEHTPTPTLTAKYSVETVVEYKKKDEWIQVKICDISLNKDGILYSIKDIHGHIEDNIRESLLRNIIEHKKINKKDEYDNIINTIYRAIAEATEKKDIQTALQWSKVLKRTLKE